MLLITVVQYNDSRCVFLSKDYSAKECEQSFYHFIKQIKGFVYNEKIYAIDDKSKWNVINEETIKLINKLLTINQLDYYSGGDNNNYFLRFGDKRSQKQNWINVDIVDVLFF